MLALSIYEAGICECGFHESLTNDTANSFAFEYRSCNVCSGVARWRRLEAEQDDRAHEQQKDAPAGAPRHDDGRRLTVRMLSQVESFLRQARRPGRSR